MPQYLLNSMILLTKIALWLVFMVASSGYANYTSPNNPSNGYTIMTVSELIAIGRDAQDVEVTGYFVEQLGSDEFILSDDSGTVRVEVDDDLKHLHRFDDTTLLRVRGELEVDTRHDDRRVEIEADCVDIISR